MKRERVGLIVGAALSAVPAVLAATSGVHPAGAAGWVVGIVEALGYWGIGLLMFFENFAPIVPSEVIMPLSGFVAGLGDLSLWLVILAGSVGSLLGQIVLYFLARWVGQPRLERWADRYLGWLTISGAEIRRSSRWFERYGSGAVLVCRVIPVLRQLISIPAGVAKMDFGRFLFYSTIGMTAWAALLAWLGSLLGANYGLVQAYLGPVTYGIVAAMVVFLIVWALRRRIAGAAASEP